MNIIKKISEKRFLKKLDEFNKSGMLRSFHYDFGRMRGDRVSYTIEEQDGELILEISHINYEKGDADTEKYDIPPVVMQQIKALIRENRIFLWKGYDKHNSMIEGDSFYLKASFDNYLIIAEGASMMPAGFDNANNNIAKFFDTLCAGV